MAHPNTRRDRCASARLPVRLRLARPRSRRVESGNATRIIALVPEFAPRIRRFGAVNCLGFWTLYVREVRPFLKVSMQTVPAPVVTTLLFLPISLLPPGPTQRHSGDIPYIDFLPPAL